MNATNEISLQIQVVDPQGVDALGLLREAARLQYTLMRLETGNRQTAAMRLCESYGFTRIPPFGPYVDDPISVCYEKAILSDSYRQKGPVQK